MKTFIFSLLFLAFGYGAFAQKTSNLKQEVATGNSQEIILNIDSTLVKIERWEGDAVQVHTQVAYEEKNVDLVTDILRADDFDLLIQWKAEAAAFELSPKPLEQYWATAQQPYMGAFYTIYLPHSIKTVTWITDIRMNN